MASVAIKSFDGADKGSMDLAADVFEAPQNQILVREVLNAYNQNQRQGTHSTKTRAFVSGGGKKPWAQKGTGNARQGSTRSPQWRHGAIVFGPLPRDYREKTNRRKRRGALRALLSVRLSEGRLIIVDALHVAEPKTKAVLAALDNLGAVGRVYIVTKEVNENLLRSTRNTLHVRTNVCNAISVYDLILADTIVMTKDAAEEIQSTLSTTKE